MRWEQLTSYVIRVCVYILAVLHQRATQLIGEYLATFVARCRIVCQRATKHIGGMGAVPQHLNDLFVLCVPPAFDLFKRRRGAAGQRTATGQHLERDDCQRELIRRRHFPTFVLLRRHVAWSSQIFLIDQRIVRVAGNAEVDQHCVAV